MSVIGWALAIGVPLLIVAGIIADDRAQAAHERRMAALGGVTPHHHEREEAET